MRALLTTLLACALLTAGCGSSGSSTSSSSSISTVANARLSSTSSAPPCSRGCDVPVGTYQGESDQGKPVVLHVSVGHLKSGPHIVSTVHIIDHFKTEYTVDCGSQKAVNNKVDTTHWGHINGVSGDLRYGENKMYVLWAPGEPITGVASVKSRGCAGMTQFTVRHTGA